MTMEEVLADIKQKPVVPIWPHLGTVLDMSRNSTYASAADDKFRAEYGIIQVGRRGLKAVTATLRKRLGIEPTTAA